MQDVKDKLEDLIPWVFKLEGALTKANVEDCGEMERRTELARFASDIYLLATTLIFCRSLDGIGGQSQVLLEKGKITRFLDKAKDARAVVKLINQLQRAILIYQVRVISCQVQSEIMRMTTGIPTAINPQPGCTVDGMFLRAIVALMLTGHLLIEVLVWGIPETQRGKVTCTRSGACTDILPEISGGDWKNQVCSFKVGQASSSGKWHG